MSGEGQLILCAGTLAGIECGFEERVIAARLGGFDAISLFPVHYLNAREVEGLSDQDMRRILDDNGIWVADLDALLDWVPGHEYHYAGLKNTDWPESLFYRIHDAIGVRSINVVWPDKANANAPDISLFSDSFGALADRAAAHGVMTHLEGLPWSNIPCVATAAEIVRQANHPNAGIIIDSWHYHRLNPDEAALLSLPPEKYFAIQINDAPATAESDLDAEANQRRLLPGEGDLKLSHMIQLLDQHGVTAPIGVEVYSTDLWKLPATEIAKRAGAAARKLLAEARQHADSSTHNV